MEQEKNSFTQSQPSAQPIKAVSARNKKIGLFLVAGPFIGVIVALAGIIVLKVFSTMYGIDSEGFSAVNIINWILSLLGLVSLIGLMIGTPIGIIFLTRRK